MMEYRKTKDFVIIAAPNEQLSTFFETMLFEDLVHSPECYNTSHTLLMVANNNGFNHANILDQLVHGTTKELLNPSVRQSIYAILKYEVRNNSYFFYSVSPRQCSTFERRFFDEYAVKLFPFNAPFDIRVI